MPSELSSTLDLDKPEDHLVVYVPVPRSRVSTRRFMEASSADAARSPSRASCPACTRTSENIARGRNGSARSADVPRQRASELTCCLRTIVSRPPRGSLLRKPLPVRPETNPDTVLPAGGDLRLSRDSSEEDQQEACRSTRAWSTRVRPSAFAATERVAAPLPVAADDERLLAGGESIVFGHLGDDSHIQIPGRFEEPLCGDKSYALRHSSSCDPDCAAATWLSGTYPDSSCGRKTSSQRARPFRNRVAVRPDSKSLSDARLPDGSCTACAVRPARLSGVVLNLPPGPEESQEHGMATAPRKRRPKQVRRLSTACAAPTNQYVANRTASVSTCCEPGRLRSRLRCRTSCAARRSLYLAKPRELVPGQVCYADVRESKAAIAPCRRATAPEERTASVPETSTESELPGSADEDPLTEDTTTTDASLDVPVRKSTCRRTAPTRATSGAFLTRGPEDEPTDAGEHESSSDSYVFVPFRLRRVTRPGEGAHSQFNGARNASSFLTRQGDPVTDNAEDFELFDIYDSESFQDDSDGLADVGETSRNTRTSQLLPRRTLADSRLASKRLVRKPSAGCQHLCTEQTSTARRITRKSASPLMLEVAVARDKHGVNSRHVGRLGSHIHNGCSFRRRCRQMDRTTLRPKSTRVGRPSMLAPSEGEVLLCDRCSTDPFDIAPGETRSRLEGEERRRPRRSGAGEGTRLSTGVDSNSPVAKTSALQWEDFPRKRGMSAPRKTMRLAPDGEGKESVEQRQRRPPSISVAPAPPHARISASCAYSVEERDVEESSEGREDELPPTAHQDFEGGEVASTYDSSDPEGESDESVEDDMPRAVEAKQSAESCGHQQASPACDSSQHMPESAFCPRFPCCSEPQQPSPQRASGTGSVYTTRRSRINSTAEDGVGELERRRTRSGGSRSDRVSAWQSTSSVQCRSSRQRRSASKQSTFTNNTATAPT